MIKTDNGDYIMSDFDIVSSIDWHDGVGDAANLLI